MSTSPVRASPEWKALARHWPGLRGTTIKALFDADAQRVGRLAVDGTGLYLDYSMQSQDASECKLEHDSSTNALIRRYRATRRDMQ